MKTIHPAIAEHALQESPRLQAENDKLREALRSIADLPIDRCSTENDYRLSGAKAIALGALSQQAEPVCQDCLGYQEAEQNPSVLCDECGWKQSEPVEPAPAQDDQEVAAVIGFYEGEREPRLLSWNVLPNGEHRLYTRPAQTEQQPIEIPVGAIENGRAFAERLEMYGFECEGGNILNCSDWQEFRQCFNHLAEWAFTLDVNAAPIAQTAPQPEQSGLRAIHAMILNALDRDAAEGKAARGEMAAELRAAMAAKEA